MKFKYVFANETVEIEVTEEWNNILVDLDRMEHNNNQTQTRRHCSLEALNLDDAYIPSEVNLERDVVAREDAAELQGAIKQLEPRQRYLISEVYLKGRSQKEIATEEGVCKSAISHTLARAEKNLRKILK